MKTTISIILICLCLGIGGFLVWKKYYHTSSISIESAATSAKPALSDKQKENTHLSKAADTKNVYWMRGLDLIWNEIEPKKGKFDWSLFDDRIKEFNQLEIYPLVIVKPFANWDQNACHPEKRYESELNPIADEPIKVGAPCDMTAYADFLQQAVERYDGDGINDMPNLKIPIKYWEIMNEPEMQGGVTGGMGEELKFFVGEPKEYLEILKNSYQAIKQADADAKVLHAGMAGMDENFQDFWRPIFKEGGNYFDIANIHTISTDERREDLFIIKFKQFLEEFQISDKPIWITEVQFGALAEKPNNLKDFEILMVKSSAFALAQGADKLFYIDNWLSWDKDNISQDKEMEKKEDKSKNKEPKIDPQILNSSTHKVYLNLVDKINQFDKIEKIKEEYRENPSDRNGATASIGQYKFTNCKNSIYILWGDADLPPELIGRLTLTDIYGTASEINASDLKLTDEPIFVELAQP